MYWVYGSESLFKWGYSLFGLRTCKDKLIGAEVFELNDAEF